MMRTTPPPGAVVRALRPGIQLHTLRSLLARSFGGTLRAVAALGYREVELAGLHGQAARVVRSLLDATGITAPAAHVTLPELRHEWPRVLDDAATLGTRWLVLGWIPQGERSDDDYRRIADLLNERGQLARARGVRMAYHNHDFELRGASPDLDLLLRETDPALVDFELDVYWVVRAGHDPVAWISRHPGRFRLLHIKDSSGAPAHDMRDPGEGTIDFARVLDATMADGALQHLFVEHDEPRDPLRTARAGYAAVGALLDRRALAPRRGSAADTTAAPAPSCSTPASAPE